MTRTKVHAEREAALAEIQRWSSALDDWTTKRDAALADLARASSTAGEEILDDPAAAERSTRAMQNARDDRDAAEKAIAAAQQRLERARNLVLGLEAKALDAEAARLERVADEHDQRTQELLAMLAEHEGPYVPEADYLSARREAGWRPELSVTLAVSDLGRTPKSRTLRGAVEIARAQAAIVRDVKAGVDPAVGLSQFVSIVDGTVAGVRVNELYPPCVWGPDAIVPAPAYLQAVAAKRREFSELQADIALGMDAPGLLERRRAIREIDQLEVEHTERASKLIQPPAFPSHLAQRRDDARRALERRRHWLHVEAPARRQQLEAELEALVGSDAARQVA